MAADEQVWVQLATRIPKSLHRELKVHCVRAEESVMGFVVQALAEKLARDAGVSVAPGAPPRRARG
jgi:predicted HicB family RNase H-like nuclease